MKFIYVQSIIKNKDSYYIDNDLHLVQNICQDRMKNNGHKNGERIMIMDYESFSKNKTQIDSFDSIIVLCCDNNDNDQQNCANLYYKTYTYKNCQIIYENINELSFLQFLKLSHESDNIYISCSINLLMKLNTIIPVYELWLIFRTDINYTIDDIENYKIFDYIAILDEYKLKNSYDNNDSETYTLIYQKDMYKYLLYDKSFGDIVENAGEKEYINLMINIMNRGNDRDDRTEIGTRSIFGPHLEFNLSKTIPLLTTKKMAWKSIIKELLWFLSGSTNSKDLEKQNVKIWSQNTTREFLNNRRLNHYIEGDIGPLYPFSFRHFGASYEGCLKSYEGKGYDQWKNLIDGLKKDPYSRRHLMTTFNPSVVDQCVIPPCHGIAIQYYVEKYEENKMGLRCHVYCRSSDVFLGLPFNIASYSILTYIVAKICDMHPLSLKISMGDAHIYKNHFDQVKNQIKRSILPEPKLVVSDSVKTKDIKEVSIEDFSLLGYFSHDAISAPMAV